MCVSMEVGAMQTTPRFFDHTARRAAGVNSVGTRRCGQSSMYACREVQRNHPVCLAVQTPAPQEEVCVYVGECNATYPRCRLGSKILSSLQYRCTTCRPLRNWFFQQWRSGRIGVLVLKFLELTLRGA